MLYNLNWDKTAKPDVMSVEGLVAWLEVQDPHTKYNWENPFTCVFATYLKSVGREYHEHSFDVDIACKRPWIYGAALARARTVIAGRI